MASSYISSKPQTNYIIPLFLFIFSVLLRLSLISKGPYHIDCLNLALQAQETLKTHQLHYLFGLGYPLTVFLGSIFIAIARIFSIDDPVFAVNLMSVFFSSLCVVANFFFAQKLFNTLTALTSSLLLNVLPSFLGISVYGTSHTPCLFFLLIGLYFLICYLQDRQSRNLFLASLALGFMGANRPQDLILMGIPISSLFFLRTDADEKNSAEKNSIDLPIRRWLVFWMITFFIVVLFHLPFLTGPTHTSYTAQFAEFCHQAFGPNFRGILSPSLLCSLVFLNFNLFPLGLILAVGGFYQLWKESTRNFIFLALWFAMPLLFYGNLHSTAPRFLIISTIPLIWALGYLLSSFWKSPTTIFKKVPVILFLLLEFFMFSNIYPVLAFRHEYDSIPEFARWIAKISEAKALIIAGDEGFFIEYYAHRTLLYRPANAFDIKDSELINFKQKLDRILSSGIPVYIDANGLYSYDAGQKFSSLIKKNYNLTFLGKHLIEEWYLGEIFADIQWQGLFKITLK